jgi:hypothetical protein
VKRAEEILGIDSPEKWYEVLLGDINKLPGGAQVLQQFGPDLYGVLMEFRPEVRWQPWMFDGR